MKKIGLYLIVLSVFIAVSCEPPVTFTEPQPAEVSSLNQFPGRLVGEYESIKDHSLLTITENSIVRSFNEDVYLAVSDLDSTVQLKNDSIYDHVFNQSFPVERLGDSIKYHIDYSDTLFLISETNVLKKFKGYYFLNTQQKQGWEVNRLNLVRGKLFMGAISKKEDIDLLKSLSESQMDTVPYQFSPTRKQFRKFIRQRGFSEEEVFVKLRKK